MDANLTVTFSASYRLLVPTASAYSPEMPGNASKEHETRANNKELASKATSLVNFIRRTLKYVPSETKSFHSHKFPL